MTPTFTDGKVTLTLAHSNAEVDAKFFECDGIQLAVTPDLCGCHTLGYRVTHPETGLALQNIYGNSIEHAYNEFMAELPHIIDQIHARHGVTFKEYLDNAAADREASIEAARRLRAEIRKEER